MLHNVFLCYCNILLLFTHYMLVQYSTWETEVFMHYKFVQFSTSSPFAYVQFECTSKFEIFDRRC